MPRLRSAHALVCAAAFLSLSVGVGCSGSSEGGEADSVSAEVVKAEVEAHRAAREARLREPDSWLSLVGLHWLKEGANPFGSGPFGSEEGNAVVFPEKAPQVAGTFHLKSGEVSVTAAADSGLRLEGEELPSGEPVELRHDQAEEGPSILSLGSLTFYAIQRGERTGIRVKDAESDVLLHFEGLEYYPPDPAWRIAGRLEPYDPPKTIPVPDVLGEVNDSPSPGALIFEIEGKEYRLDPVADPGEPLFVIFGDKTNGPETYGAGRFLYVDPPGEDGRVVIDFNLAYNPPCAFTPYATCPLPPPGNKLPIPIPAGEKKFGEDH